MTTARNASTALRQASALRDLCLRLPRVPTTAALERLRRFSTLASTPQSAGEADVEALVEGWTRWWYAGETVKLAAMANKISHELIATNRLLATFATAARLVSRSAGG